MPDRHVELPAHPDLEYYRKQAKHLLRMYAAGESLPSVQEMSRWPACTILVAVAVHRAGR